MCGALVWSFDAIAAINWLEVIKAFAPVATAVIAYLALQNWRRQDKAKRQAEFLDTLIEAVHTVVAEMPAPITMLEMAKIGMKSREPASESVDKETAGAIAYIQEHGKSESKRLSGLLEVVQPSVVRLRSLVAKGQVFKFDDYAKCQNAVALLTWNFDRIETFMVVMGSPTWNWENPEVQKLLKDIMAITPSDLRKSLKETNVAVLEYTSDAYKQIYG